MNGIQDCQKLESAQNANQRIGTEKQKTKRCYSCNEEKLLNLFKKNTNKCKQCCHLYNTQYRLLNLDKIKANDKIYKKSRQSKIQKYREEHRAIANAYAKEYRSRNKKKILKVNQAYKAQKAATDLKYKLNRNISNSIRKALGKNKNGLHWEDITGYTLDELKKHLEKQFTEGMTWRNYGDWHIDHKLPIAAFNFKTPDHTDFKKCWALKNLQPMWAKDNIIKSNKLSKHFQPSLLL